VAAMEQIGKRRLERLIEVGDRSYDPGDNSEQVRRMEVELRKQLPTLFKKSQHHLHEAEGKTLYN
jgi:hypothetical protein